MKPKHTRGEGDETAKRGRRKVFDTAFSSRMELKKGLWTVLPENRFVVLVWGGKSAEVMTICVGMESLLFVQAPAANDML